MVQQPLLSPQAAAVAAEFTVLPNDAVARNHDRDAILAIGTTNGPLSTRVFQSFGHRGVRRRFAAGNLTKPVPDPFLKWRPSYIERCGKRPKLALEVRPQVPRPVV